MGFVQAPAGTVLPVDLKDLVPETQTGQGRGGVSLHQLDKHSLREETGNPKNSQNEIREMKRDGDSGEKTKEQLKRKKARTQRR